MEALKSSLLTVAISVAAMLCTAVLGIIAMVTGIRSWAPFWWR